MPRAATDVMQSVIFSAVLDAIAALKTASGGLPNNLLRQVQAIHNNVTFADLPKELQDAIGASVRTAFTQLLKEGYSVAPRDSTQVRSAPRHGELVDRGGRNARGPRPAGPGGRPSGPGGPPRTGRPGGGPGGGGPGGGRPGGGPGGGRPSGGAGGPGGGKPRGPRKPPQG